MGVEEMKVPGYTKGEGWLGGRVVGPEEEGYLNGSPFTSTLQFVCVCEREGTRGRWVMSVSLDE